MHQDVLEATVNHARLKQRAEHYAARVGDADCEALRALTRFLDSPLAARILLLDSVLQQGVINDAYKPKMRKLYAKYFRAVEADFSLNLRKSPFSLELIQTEDSELFADFMASLEALAADSSVTDRSERILQDYFGFETSQEMRDRAKRNGVAPLTWQEFNDDGRRLGAFSHGPVDAVSSMESSATQAVQEVTIRAQARDLYRRTGILLDRTERLANSLGHLACVVSRLSGLAAPVKLALFAGRRSTDRLFLLLQNAMCAETLPGYAGTSSIFAVDHIDAALLDCGMTSLQDRQQHIGPLVGTHAHEVMSITAQLLSCWDDQVKSEDGGPMALSALLAHLLFLAANGGMDTATALADTFGTEAFLAAALVTRLPQEFVDDMAAMHSCSSIQPGAVVFDVFRMWRLDSGDYAAVAEAVVQAWERRSGELGAHALPKPGLMNSNLSSVEDILEAARLPERIRPTICAFGGLADRFLPFDAGGERTVELGLANVVMKAVQARRAGVATSMPCAGKYGDDASHSKAQVDIRIPREQQEVVKERMQRMAAQRRIDPQSASSVLSSMYHEVTRKQIFN